jgi:hypothetical protein
MYMGCSVETYIYACFTIGRAHICGKIMFLSMEFAKGFQVCIGKWNKEF